jgi:iron complex transport system substrate-binding protein
MLKGPQRIVCLTEETTEWLYLLGQEHRIVGISAYTVRPEQAKTEKPVVSAFVSGSLPKILALKPDLVVGFSDIQGNLAKQLIEAGLNVMVFNQRSIDEIFSVMETMAGIVGQASRAENLISEMRAKLELIERQSTKRPHRPKVFFQEWDEPIISAIRWVSEAIEIAGGRDIFAETRSSSLAKDRIVSAEAVRERNPDLILGSWCGKPMDFDWIRAKHEWKNVSAIKNKKIYEIDSAVILQPGPALFLEGLDRLSEAITSF